MSHKQKLVVIDDVKVFQLLNDSRFVSQFPDFINEINKHKIQEGSLVFNGCRPCQKKSKQANIDSMVIKRKIASLSEIDLNKVKEIGRAHV